MTFPSLMTVPRPLLDTSEPKGATHVAGVDGGGTKTVAAVLDLLVMVRMRWRREESLLDRLVI